MTEKYGKAANEAVLNIYNTQKCMSTSEFDCLIEAMNRLMDYEDIGLEPKEVETLAKAGQSGWINPKDRMPEKLRPVIICREVNKGEYKVEQGNFAGNGLWKVYGTSAKRITCWMPMPKPPAMQEEAEENGTEKDQG